MGGVFLQTFSRDSPEIAPTVKVDMLPDCNFSAYPGIPDLSR